MSGPAAAGPIREVTLLTNPAAGGGRAEKAARRAAARLRERGIEVLATTGSDAAHSLRLAREAVARGTGALVVAGGDGMISLALQALAGSGVPLGVIPAGTGNDHAREFGIPLKAPEAAADVIVDGRVETVDLGRIQAADGTVRIFGSVLATGFDSLVSDRTNQLRWPHGRMRYNLAILVEFANLRPLPFRLVLADGTVVDRPLTLAAVGNTRSYGGGMVICPGADRTDGLFDVTLVHAMARLRVARFFPTVFKGTHVRRSEVETHRTASLRIESPGINAYADGEYVGPLPAEVRVLPRSLDVLVPGTTAR
ncbi:diacylglycerol kinase [Kitasatospora herbaricolor]|uniref:Diacylglycerol kinase n=1 Tax=Kitasatospora herbaricolor TaxID=68217 RepID=A0ABZ1W1Q3_9ACTN|nr:diacylglycerol kinase [Kitasatospora herbaricolor]